MQPFLRLLFGFNFSRDNNLLFNCFKGVREADWRCNGCVCLPQLFICQYHIWLAADTKGILVLIPGNPSLNILVSTFIFVCVAHEISLITNDLAQVVIPKDSVALLKRLGATGLLSLVVLLLARDSQPTPGA